MRRLFQFLSGTIESYKDHFPEDKVIVFQFLSGTIESFFVVHVKALIN